MPDKNNSAAVILNRQAANLAIYGILINALARQAPDKAALIRDFSEMAEDHAIRTMFSAMPEEFFQQLQLHRATWVEMLQNISEST
jgi:hypothetical protein